jgi:3-deoxy-D-manno-octulosonic-acid transferase
MGELGLFYRLATLAFIGGSLVPHGGQNPIEAAKLGCPIIHGPHTRNFSTIYADFDDCGGAVPVMDAASLATLLPRLLADAQARSAMVQAASALVAREEGAMARTMATLVPYLAVIGGKRI